MLKCHPQNTRINARESDFAIWLCYNLLYSSITLQFCKQEDEIFKYEATSTVSLPCGRPRNREPFATFDREKASEVVQSLIGPCGYKRDFRRGVKSDAKRTPPKEAKNQKVTRCPVALKVIRVLQGRQVDLPGWSKQTSDWGKEVLRRTAVQAVLIQVGWDLETVIVVGTFIWVAGAETPVVQPHFRLLAPAGFHWE